MAVTWEFDGTIINAEHKEISMLATRTDSESSDPPVIVDLPKISVRTTTHKLRALDKIYAMGNTELQRRIDDAVFQIELDALEVQAKNNLEARDN